MKTYIPFLISSVMAAGCGGGAKSAPTSEAASAPMTAEPTARADAQAPIPVDRFDGTPYFGDRPSCFLMLDDATGRASATADQRCDERFLPFSTFKIPNALIGLETGTVAGPETVIPWDRERYPAEAWWPEAWQRDNDLRRAFQASAVPYFQAMAVRIGEPTMAEYVDRFDYGNEDIGGGIDQFWLQGDLRISAREEIAFLRAFHERRLPARPENVAVVEDIMSWERGPGYVIRAKTGAGYLAEDQGLRWFVGFVEEGQGEAAHTVYFAMNMSMADLDDVPREQMMALARTILRDRGALGPNAPAQRP